MAHYFQLDQIDDPITSRLRGTTKDEIEKKRKVDHHLIDIKATMDQDVVSGTTHTNKSANQIFNDKFKNLNSSRRRWCTISKVTAALRESNPDAYKPHLISIGPYHKNNPQLHPMEKYKLMYLQRFLGRKDGIDVESCINEMEKLEHEALKCYVDLDDDGDCGDINIGKFSELLLLDGCFVVEYIREHCGKVPEGEGVIMNTDCICSQVHRDFLLLENQLPFFILAKLYEMTMNVTDNVPFTKLVEDTFYNWSTLKWNRATCDLKTEGNIKHLLQAVHYMCCHPSNQMKTNRRVEERHSMAIAGDKDFQTRHFNMPNATELYEAGVKFSKVGCSTDGGTTRFVDIKFKNGLMEIPYFEVFDSTETIVRNLIAYERQSYDVNPKYVSNYVAFMDYLIDSDVD